MACFPRPFQVLHPPPSSRTFFIDDPRTGVQLTGAPDGILVRADDSKVIVDYKTAKHTAGQDELYPMYEVQLNGYAAIADKVGLGPVSGIALAYTEPVTQGTPNLFRMAGTRHGFRMGFDAKIVGVKLDRAILPPTLRKARKICDASMPPKGATGCEDCASFEALSLASRGWP